MKSKNLLSKQAIANISKVSIFTEKTSSGNSKTTDFSKQEVTQVLALKAASVVECIPCTNMFCHIRILKSEETISNLTKLLDQQLQIVDESQMELRDLRDKNEELLQKMDNSCEEFQGNQINTTSQGIKRR